ncbi:DUF262 domain-containing protein [Streptomyces sp. NPDC088746]|uniref:GmrSD restriction endonuclease domain-containing protein n=1 Tax=Streptomyces sp. NPDC088746 TaxID=3365885 RepID=UPI00380A93F9
MQQRVMVFSLHQLVGAGLSGRFRSSSFSRPMVWGPQQIADFFDSLARGFPVGQLVVYEGPAPEEELELGGRTIHAPEDSEAWMVIDGLQRLSSLIGAWDARESSPYELCYDLEGRRFVPGPASHLLMLPVPVLVHGERLKAWLRERPFLSETDQSHVRTLSHTLTSYSIPVTVVMSLADERFELFQRLNQGGSSLTRADIDRAKSRPRSKPQGLRGIVQRVEGLGFGRLSEEAAAHCAVASAPMGRATMPVTEGEALDAYHSMSLHDREIAERRARQVLSSVVDYLRQTARIPHVRLLPQPLALPAAVRLFAHCRRSADHEARELLRRWVWRADDSFQMHEAMQAPVEQTAFDEAQRLLAHTSPRNAQRYTSSLWATDLSTVHGRLNALGMLHAWPVSITAIPDLRVDPGFPLEAPQVLTPWLDSGAPAFAPFVPHDYEPELTLGCFLLHPPAPANDLRQGLLALSYEDFGSLEYHLFDKRSVRLLQDNRIFELVEHREEVLKLAINKRIQSFARRGFRAGRKPTLTDTSRGPDGQEDR